MTNIALALESNPLVNQPSDFFSTYVDWIMTSQNCRVTFLPSLAKLSINWNEKMDLGNFNSQA